MLLMLVLLLAPAGIVPLVEAAWDGGTLGDVPVTLGQYPDGTGCFDGPVWIAEGASYTPPPVPIVVEYPCDDA
jgi:hypothetical protein